MNRVVIALAAGIVYLSFTGGLSASPLTIPDLEISTDDNNLTQIRRRGGGRGFRGGRSRGRSFRGGGRSRGSFRGRGRGFRGGYRGGRKFYGGRRGIRRGFRGPRSYGKRGFRRGRGYRRHRGFRRHRDFRRGFRRGWRGRRWLNAVPWWGGRPWLADHRIDSWEVTCRSLWDVALAANNPENWGRYYNACGYPEEPPAEYEPEEYIK